MLEWARHGARELDWIVAERQIGGRGRHGRQWISPSGNLYATTLVKLRDGDPPAHTLALVAAIAAHHTIKELLGDFDRVRIKWPNDILIDGVKAAGILLERDTNSVVMGFGINVASSPKDIGRETTFILEHRDLNINPKRVHEYLASYVKQGLEKWRRREQGGLDWVLDAWLKCSVPIGTGISVNTGADTLDGLFDGLDEAGALRLRLADGSVRVIQAGDVFLL